MISCDLVGRLGNQCFQIATTIAHAKRINTTYCIPRRTMDPRVWPTYFNHFPYCKSWIGQTYPEPTFSYTPIVPLNYIKLHGYFQSEKYFIDYRDEILKSFLINRQVWSINLNTVAIHVRRGDYLQYSNKHPVLPIEYYKEAIKYFDGCKFVIFSDDIEWCKNNFRNGHYSFNEEKDSLQAMFQMSDCEHQIIANSSFSWWGAWLNQINSKIVIAPSIWFGPGNSHLDTTDLIPDSWIRI